MSKEGEIYARREVPCPRLRTTENARCVRGHAPPEKNCNRECQIRDFLPFSLKFSTYNSSKVNYILNNNILYFTLSCVDIYN